MSGALAGLITLLIEPIVEKIALNLLATILHKREADPEFRVKSDQVFAKVVAAQSKEEALNASQELQKLTSSL